MLQYGYLVWGSIICAGLVTADALGWQTPSLGISGGSSYGSGSSGYYSSPSRGWGGSSSWGGGK